MNLIPHAGATWDDGTDPATIVPAGFGTGLIKRDYAMYPQGCYANAAAFPDSELIDESEWGDRWNEKMKNKSSLLHIREDNYDALKSLNQSSYPLCWAFSSTKAEMYVRFLMGLPPERLSGWYTAGMANGWRSEGGWGANSMRQAIDGGMCSLDECPSFSRNYATAENAAKAATRKITEWWDGIDDTTLARKQAVSMFLKDIPCVIDLNAMSHSMCAIWFTPNPFTIIYDNSWDEQGDRGLYKGSGAYASPNGLVIPRVSTGR